MVHQFIRIAVERDAQRIGHGRDEVLVLADVQRSLFLAGSDADRADALDDLRERRTKGRNAQSNNILAAKAVAEAVRSTLGPKGMDKMLVDSMGDVVITNDGATILKEIDVAHPAAKKVYVSVVTQRAYIADWDLISGGLGSYTGVDRRFERRQ